MNQETSDVVLSIIEVIDQGEGEPIARIVWMMSGAILVGEDGCIWSPFCDRVVTIDPATARKARLLLAAWERWATEDGVDPLRVGFM